MIAMISNDLTYWDTVRATENCTWAVTPSLYITEGEPHWRLHELSE